MSAPLWQSVKEGFKSLILWFGEMFFIFREWLHSKLCGGEVRSQMDRNWGKCEECG